MKLMYYTNWPLILDRKNISNIYSNKNMRKKQQFMKQKQTCIQDVPETLFYSKAFRRYRMFKL